MDSLFSEYENSLIGAQKEIGIYNFYGAEPGGANQQRALLCIRYALEKVLGWDVETSIKKFDAYIIRIMKLERIVDFIVYPDEVEPRNPRYILSLLYPERIHLNYQKLVLEVMQGVLEGKRQFPREYFVGPDGFSRYCLCLQYLIMNYHPVSSIDELYQFLLSPEGNKFLLENRLRIPADQLKIDILSCIHEITLDEPSSELYYCFYAFQKEYKKTH